MVPAAWLLAAAAAWPALLVHGDCDFHLSTYTCGQIENDFRVTQGEFEMPVTFALDVALNKAHVFMMTEPLNMMKTLEDQSPDNLQCAWTMVTDQVVAHARDADMLTRCTEHLTAITACGESYFSDKYNEDVGGADGSGTVTLSLALGEIVGALNEEGNFVLYVQRAMPTTIVGARLLWIAEQACKLRMPVGFSCGVVVEGQNMCVNINTIVCASFVGIDPQSYGTLKVECKMPAKIHVREWVRVSTDHFNEPLLLESAFTAAWVFSTRPNDLDGDGVSHGSGMVPIGDGSLGSGMITGEVAFEATLCEQGPKSGAAGFEGCNTDTLPVYEAPYNITRGMPAPKITVDSLPIAIVFKPGVPGIPPDFPVAATVPTMQSALMSHRVEYGEITYFQTAYLQVTMLGGGALEEAGVTFKEFVVSWAVDFSGGPNAGVYPNDRIDDGGLGSRSAIDVGDDEDCKIVAEGFNSLGKATSVVGCPNLMMPGVEPNIGGVLVGDKMTFSMKFTMGRKITDPDEVLGRKRAASGKAALFQFPEGGMIDESKAMLQMEITVYEGSGEVTVADPYRFGPPPATPEGGLPQMYLIAAIAGGAALLAVAAAAAAVFMWSRRGRSRGRELVAPAQGLSPTKYMVDSAFSPSGNLAHDVTSPTTALGAVKLPCRRAGCEEPRVPGKYMCCFHGCPKCGKEKSSKASVCDVCQRLAPRPKSEEDSRGV